MRLVQSDTDWPLGPCYELNDAGQPEVWVTPLGTDEPVRCLRPVLTETEWRLDWLNAINQFIPLDRIGLSGMRDVIAMLGGVAIIPDLSPRHAQ